MKDKWQLKDLKNEDNYGSKDFIKIFLCIFHHIKVTFIVSKKSIIKI